ncbi:hypothetical protein EVAR_43044_1 [Eumeta japonica]|uniref:Uncharacterized protein n=1 Tax=Eumeta variegata TaxID=151549 RepID=A0A4C1XKQ8_EUMVA|nr:hypothetical protein EVAR_43044_1 [Eumeta japonica]
MTRHRLHLAWGRAKEQSRCDWSSVCFRRRPGAKKNNEKITAGDGFNLTFAFGRDAPLSHRRAPPAPAA